LTATDVDVAVRSALRTGDEAVILRGVVNGPLSAIVPHPAGIVAVPEKVTVVVVGVAPETYTFAVKEM
jgi:hypothetical protein